MRVFIAIDIKEFKKELLRLQDLFRDYGKTTEVRTFHLTLKFLGEIDKRKLEDVRDKLKEVKFKDFEIKMGRLGIFPNEKFMRILWVDVEPKREIIELQQKIDGVLKDIFEKDKKFKPHVTLGRIKYLRDKEKFKEMLKERVGDAKIRVKSFKLIKSELTANGPVYETIESYGKEK